MLSIALLATSLASAGETVHEVELSGGVSYVSRNDRMVSALPHRGVAPSFDLGWSPRGPRFAHVLAVSFTPAALRSGEPWAFTHDGDTLHTGNDAAVLADLRYAVGRRLTGDRWTLHLGGTVAGHFENVNTHYGFNGMETYLGLLDLGPWVDLRVDLAERHTLELQAWAPIAAWTARNPYAVHSGQHIYNTRANFAPLTILRYLADGRPQTLNHYQAIHVRLGYSLALTDAFALVAQARLDGLHYSIPYPIEAWQLGLNLGVRGRF